MLKRSTEKRTEERVPAGLRVRLGNNDGITRDVSASGIRLEIGGTFLHGQPVTFGVEVETAAGKIALWCSGEVLRIDHHGPQQHVAVKIHRATLSADAIRFTTGGGA